LTGFNTILYDLLIMGRRATIITGDSIETTYLL